MSTIVHSFKIGEYLIAPGAPAMIVGEVAQAHDGSLGTAHAFIDVIADAGADAVKFQTHIAKAESSPQEPFRVKFSFQDATRYDYWKRMEFTSEGWQGLADHARKRGLIFLSSPFSEEAVDLLDRIGMPAWKVASGEVNNPLLLERIAKTGKPVLLSSGMSSIAEIDEVVKAIQALNLPLMVLQCTSKYPSKPEDVGLNMLETFRERYQTPVGLSDHSGKIYPGLAAAALGVEMIEVHVTLSRQMFGPDVVASLTPGELAQLVEGVRFIEKTKANPMAKDENAASMKEMRALFGKSLVAARDLQGGEILQRRDVTVRKPGTGIPAADAFKYIGRKLIKNVNEDEFFSSGDFEEKA
ncbi:MAG: N-acetylneuraminate synthase family protein [Anaerolineaceae bacterium]